MADELRVEAAVENLSAVTAFVTAPLAVLHCTQKERFQIELVTEEIFVNIASYAYPASSGSVVIERRTMTDPPALCLTFRDSGIPYDPLQQEPPDLTLELKDRPIGGLGVFLVREIVDEMRYEYRDGQNVLTLTKIIRPDST
ncbi:MAG: ATP-binding protein [Schwartzia sp.]|nr:ATP-binding protein [Schwartzia sp. (in: firmicutes)]